MNESGKRAQGATHESSIREFLSAADARVERWRALNRLTKALAAGQDVAAQERNANAARALLAELAPVEELNAYPGPHLMSVVRERLQGSDWTGLARLVQRIGMALLSNSYRDDASEWNADDDEEPRTLDVLPPALGRGQSR
jgi:arginine decarboxylase